MSDWLIQSLFTTPINQITSLIKTFVDLDVESSERYFLTLVPVEQEIE